MIFSFQSVLKEFKLKFFVHILIFFCFFNNTLIAQDKEIVCKGTDTSKWTKCKGSSSSKNGTQYSGEWLDGKLDGYGSFTYKNGELTIGYSIMDKKSEYIVVNKSTVEEMFLQIK